MCKCGNWSFIGLPIVKGKSIYIDRAPAVFSYSFFKLLHIYVNVVTVFIIHTTIVFLQIQIQPIK
jgi:hypothetical protein